MTSNADFIRIGVVTGSHGLNGRLKIFIISDIMERFSRGNRVFVSTEGIGGFFEIEEFLPRKGKTALLKLGGIDTVERAAACKGAELLIPAGEAGEFRNKLAADEFLYSDIIGCTVFRDDEEFGAVKDIIQAGAGDILIVAGKDGREYMIPFVTSMVDTSRIAEGAVTIYPVDGLFDL